MPLLGPVSFQVLPARRQARYVAEHGRYLLHRWQDNYSISLYWLGSFFCELWLEQECREPERYRVLTGLECLDAYAPFLAEAEY